MPPKSKSKSNSSARSWPPRRTPRTAARKSVPALSTQQQNSPDDVPQGEELNPVQSSPPSVDDTSKIAALPDSDPGTDISLPESQEGENPVGESSQTVNPESVELGDAKEEILGGSGLQKPAEAVNETTEAAAMEVDKVEGGDGRKLVEPELGVSRDGQENVNAGGSGSGKRKVVKKTVRVVKKVVKKRVPKRVMTGGTVEGDSEKMDDGVESKDELTDLENQRKLDVMNVEKAEGHNILEKKDVDESVNEEMMNLKPPIASPLDMTDVAKVELGSILSAETETLRSTSCISAEVENGDLNQSAVVDEEDDKLDSANVAEAVKSRHDIEVSITDDSQEVSASENQTMVSGNSEYSNAGEVEVSGVENENVKSTAKGIHGDSDERAVGSDLGKDNATVLENVDYIEHQNAVSKGQTSEEGLKEVENSPTVNGGLYMSGEMEAIERRKRRRTEIFIGGLDKDATEEDIRKIFESVGQIVEVRLVMNSKTGKNKGFAFVRYASAADAKTALAKFSKVEICGRECGVSAVEGNDTIFLGNIDKKWKSEDIIQLLKEAGVEKIDKVTVMADPNNTEQNRGFAFLEFETCKDAQISFAKFQKKDIFGKHLKIKVAWAQPLIEPDEEAISKVKSVYAEYLPSSWDEDKVKKYFQKFGEIENVALAKNLPSSRRKDFAFVNYTSREAALACIEAFAHEQMDDDGSKLKVKVSLAKPIAKSKQPKPVANSPKEVFIEKKKAVQHAFKPHGPRIKVKHSGYHEVFRSETKSSTNDELLWLLRQQASVRPGQTGLVNGFASVEHQYSLTATKRPLSMMESDLHGRGLPRPRLENPYPLASTSSLPRGIVVSSYSNYHQQDDRYASESVYGASYRGQIQMRNQDTHLGNSGLHHRYRSH